MIALLLGLALAAGPTTEAEVEAARQAWVVYASSVTDKVWPIFETHLRDHPLPDGSYVWKARLVVDREGKLVQVTLSEASGHEEADAALIAAFQHVAEYGAPPEVWIQSTDEAVFGDLTFTLETKKSLDGVIGVPFEK